MKEQNKAYIFASIAVLMWSTVATAFKIALRYVDYSQLLLLASFASLMVLFFAIMFQNKFKLLKMPFIEKIRYLIHEIQLQMRGKTWQQRPCKIKLPGTLPFWCTQPFHIMTINWNGDVFPCCALHDNKAVMGNLLETEINELWNNNEFKKCRDYLFASRKKSNTNSVCELCSNGELIL